MLATLKEVWPPRPQAHEIYAGHLGAKKTKERIILSFTWPTIAYDVQKTCESCHQCQKKRRVTVYDRVPITPIPRGDRFRGKVASDNPFDSVVMDCIGPLFSNQKVEYNYALVLCDSNTRYPFAVPHVHSQQKVCAMLCCRSFS